MSVEVARSAKGLPPACLGRPADPWVGCSQGFDPPVALHTSAERGQSVRAPRRWHNAWLKEVAGAGRLPCQLRAGAEAGRRLSLGTLPAFTTSHSALIASSSSGLWMILRPHPP